MADDKLRDDSQTTALDNITSAAATALAVGAGAASFLRSSGGAGRFGRQLERMSKSMAVALHEYESHTVDDWGRDEISRVASKLRSSWKEAGENVKTDIELDTSSQNNVFGAIQNYIQIRNNPADRAKTAANGVFIMQPIIKESIQKYANGDRNISSRIINFVDDIAGKVDNEGAINEKALDHFRGTKLLSEGAHTQIAMRMRELRDKHANDYRDFVASIEKAATKIINPKKMEERYGSLYNPTIGQKIKNKTLGDRPATVEEILTAVRTGKQKTKDGFSFRDNERLKWTSVAEGLQDVMNELAKGHNGKEDVNLFGKIFADEKIRIDGNGNIYSLKTTSDFYNKMLDYAADTLPGTLAKMRDKLSVSRSPIVDVVGAGSQDPILARIAEKSKDSILNHSYISVYDQVFTIGKGGELNHVKEMDGSYLISGTVSHTSRMLKKMYGDAGTREVSNKLMRSLGIGEDATLSEPELFMSKFQKMDDPHWSGNMIKAAIDSDKNLEISDMLKYGWFSREHATEYIAEQRELNTFIGKSVGKLSGEAVRKLGTAAAEKRVLGTNNTVGDLFNALEAETDKELIDRVKRMVEGSVSSTDSFKSKDLALLMSSYINNTHKTEQLVRIGNPRSKFFDGYEVRSFGETLRTEVAKEIFAQIDNGGKEGPEAVYNFIKEAGLSKESETGAHRLATWVMMQQRSGVVNKPMHIGQEDSAINEMVTKIFMAQNEGTELTKQHKEMVQELISEHIDAFEDVKLSKGNIIEPSKYNTNIHMKKWISPLDLLRDMNNGTKDGATIGNFFKQFTAGRNDVEHATTATMFPYFLSSRLSDSMNFGARVGLGPQDMGSTADVMKGLILKRIMPLSIAVTYLDYANDVFRELTGNSALGTMYQGVANIDVAIRRGMDVTGLAGVYSNEKAVNPFLQYWTEGSDYQDADQREEWYKNGYSPVRKNRGWWFGSTSEIRGGKIDHWAPNFLRSETANAKDVSLYGGFWDKWSHSWLPTPTNPLSPLAALADPYWLEEKHSEDRPYPVSGSLFTDGTPWGAVLNPTLGELIKPRVKMHEDRLDGNFVDVRALIERENASVYRKSEEHYFKLKNGNMEVLDYTPFGAPTLSDRIASLRINKGNITGAFYDTPGYYSGGMTTEEYEQLNKSQPGGDDGTGQGLGGANSSKQMQGDGSVPPVLLTEASIGEEPIGLTTKEKLMLEAGTNGTLSGMAKEYLERTGSAAHLRSMNQQIIDKSKTSKAGGVFTSESMWNETKLFGDKFMGGNIDPEDLASVGDIEDDLNSASIAARQLSGIYGWIGGSVLDMGRPTKHLANANVMDGYQRSFWDLNLGGFGGETMEIARRFIPEYKRRFSYNPLMNMMPDWLPDRFRFGDAFSSVSDGEERLPGKGYEALNELHPDQFGEYGALDRYKILADIAPNSAEYKAWKKIAQRTVVDKDQREEIKTIAKRVREQLKDHDFYDYKFLGRGVEQQNAVVSEVIDNNHFKIYGDEQIYRLSGVRVLNDKNNSPTLVNYLHAGQDVVLGVDENQNYRQANDTSKSINASVMVDGENLSEMLLEQGLAKIRKGDTSATATFQKFNFFRIMEGKSLEFLSHLDVPYFSDKVARIRSPLESYKAEQVYGTSFQSWDHPIDSFLTPALERSFTSSASGQLFGEAAWAMHHYLGSRRGTSALFKRAADLTYILSNRGAFAGYVVGKILKSNDSNLAKTLAGAGMIAQKLGYTAANYDKPIVMASTGALVGGFLGNIFGKKPGRISRIGALTGAAIGAIGGGTLSIGLNANNTQLVDRLFNGERSDVWIPEHTRKKWEVEEYFDRLRYVKYMGLYEKAASLAESEEDVDIKYILEKYDEQTAARKEIKQELTNAKTKIKAFMQDGSLERRDILAALNAKLEHLSSSEMTMKGGEYTHAAIMYKQAAESTNYGLKKGATYVDMMRALPKADRDYFMEMVKEKDPDKQKEILQYASPSLRKILGMAWGVDQPEAESNEEYFSKHELPGLFWAGWRPDVDLRNVEVKTVYNEGMLLSDLGYYETQLEEPGVINAPQASPFDGPDNPVAMRMNLMGTLKGLGLTGVDVRIEPSRTEGIQTVFNAVRNTQYKVQEKINNALSF